MKLRITLYIVFAFSIHATASNSVNKTLIKNAFIKTVIDSSTKAKPIELPITGATLKALIPKGWRLLATASGDLNNDGIEDIVFAIQNTLTKHKKHHDGLGTDIIDLNPRLLGIYFGNIEGTFTKQLQSDTFIVLRDVPTMDEPLAGIKILKNGALQIDFHFWYSAGSWQMSNHQYTFRYKHKAFQLINYTSGERHRGTGEETDYDVNFITKTIKISTTYFDDDTEDKKEETKVKTFKLKQLKSIKTLGSPFEWEFQNLKI